MYLTFSKGGLQSSLNFFIMYKNFVYLLRVVLWGFKGSECVWRFNTYMQFRLTQVFYNTILFRIALKGVLCFQLQIIIGGHEDIDDGWNIVRRGVYV